MKENDIKKEQVSVYYVSNGGYFDLNLSIYIDENRKVHEIKDSASGFLSILFEDGKIDIYNTGYSYDNIRQIAKRINDSMRASLPEVGKSRSKASSFLITDAYGAYVVNPRFLIKDSPFSDYEIFKTNKFKETLSLLDDNDRKILYSLYLIGDTGLELSYSEEWLGLDLADEYSSILNRLEANGLVYTSDNKIRLTVAGSHLCAAIVEENLFDIDVIKSSLLFFVSVIRTNTYSNKYNWSEFNEIQFNVIKTLVNELKPVENWVLQYIASAANGVRHAKTELAGECAKYIDYAWNKYDDTVDSIENKLDLLRICICGGNTRASLKEPGYRAAIRYFNAAEEIVDKYLRPVNESDYTDDIYYHLGWFYNDIGFFYLRYSDYVDDKDYYLDLSEKYLIEAHRIKTTYVKNFSNELRANRTIAVTCSNLSNLYRIKAKYDEALKYITECIDIRTKFGLCHAVASAEAQKSRIYLNWYFDNNDESQLVKAKLIIDSAINKWLESKKDDTGIKQIDMRVPFLTDDPDDMLYKMLRTKVEIEKELGNEYFAMHFETYLPE